MLEWARTTNSFIVEDNYNRLLRQAKLRGGLFLRYTTFDEKQIKQEVKKLARVITVIPHMI